MTLFHVFLSMVTFYVYLSVAVKEEIDEIHLPVLSWILVAGILILLSVHSSQQCWRGNEPPNQTVLAAILKEVKEIEQTQNDSLCTERRIPKMLFLIISHNQRNVDDREKKWY